MKHDTLANILFYLSNDDVLLDYGTRYVQTHQKPASVAVFSLSDQDFEDFKQMAIDSDFKYDRLSERRLKDLKATAEFEGYYNEAKAEFDALEKKLQHNLGLEFNHFKKDIMILMRQEIVKRWFFQRGISEEQLKDDEDAIEAISLLNDLSRYRSILQP
jgi:carboxyl-terminal processing protease